MPNPDESLSPAEVQDAWSLGIPLEAIHLSDQQIKRAIEQGRTAEACSTSSMGTAETYWRLVHPSDNVATSDLVVYPPGEPAHVTAFEDRADDRDVEGVLWNPFYHEQATALANAIAAMHRPQVLTEYARILAAIELPQTRSAQLRIRAPLIAALHAVAPARPEQVDGWLQKQRRVRHLADGIRARWLTHDVAAAFTAVTTAVERIKSLSRQKKAVRLALLQFGLRVGCARPWTPIQLTGVKLADIPQAPDFFNQLITVLRSANSDPSDSHTMEYATSKTRELLSAKPRRSNKKIAPAPTLFGIERCPTCTTIPQQQLLNYDTIAARPPVLDALETIAAERTAESPEAWREHSLARCPVCSTFYRIVRSKDEGHSFMDPTLNLETITRITPHTALEQLGEYPGTAATTARQTLTAAIPPLLNRLATLAIEGGTPNWHIRNYACQATIHAALLNETHPSPVAALLDHSDRVVQVCTLRELLELAAGIETRVGDRSLKAWLQQKARAFLTQHPPLPPLTAILQAPVKPTSEFDPTLGIYHTSTTHRIAAKCTTIATQLTPPIP